MTATISTTSGGERFVCINHNIRTEKVVSKEEHINPKGDHENWVNRDIKNMYHELFDDAIKEYNKTQTRFDRKITDYFQKIKKDKQKNFAYEMIVGIYQKKCNIPTEIKKEILKEYYKWFDKEFGEHLKICGAYYHNDECGNDPHLHLDYIPVAYNMTKGMKKQNSLTQALNQLGFITESKSLTNQMKFERYCNDKLEELCKERNINVEHPMREYKEINGKNIRHKSTQQYIYDELQKSLQQKESAIEEYNIILNDVNRLSDIRNDKVKELETMQDELNKNIVIYQNQNNFIKELETELNEKKNETMKLDNEYLILNEEYNNLNNEYNLLLANEKKEEKNITLEDILDFSSDEPFKKLEMMNQNYFINKFFKFKLKKLNQIKDKDILKNEIDKTMPDVMKTYKRIELADAFINNKNLAPTRPFLAP